MVISDVISLLKEVQSLAKDVKSKPLNDAIVNLQESVINLENNYLELEEKYNELRKRVTASDEVYLDDDGFVCVKGRNDKYCPKCCIKRHIADKANYRFMVCEQHGENLVPIDVFESKRDAINHHAY